MNPALVMFKAVVNRRKVTCDWCGTEDIECFEARSDQDADICDTCVLSLADYIRNKQIQEMMAQQKQYLPQTYGGVAAAPTPDDAWANKEITIPITDYFS